MDDTLGEGTTASYRNHNSARFGFPSIFSWKSPISGVSGLGSYASHTVSLCQEMAFMSSVTSSNACSWQVLGKLTPGSNSASSDL